MSTCWYLTLVSLIEVGSYIHPVASRADHDTYVSFVPSLPKSGGGSSGTRYVVRVVVTIGFEWPGTHPPRIFITHWWGQPFNDLIARIEQLVHDFRANLNEETDARGGGMTEDTPVWISAFAISQWALEEEEEDDDDDDDDLDGDKVMDSALVKAMRIVSCRIASILDSSGVVFSRLWYDYELYMNLTLRRKKGRGDPNNGAGILYFGRLYRPQALHYRHSLLNSYSFMDHDDEERAAVGNVPGGASGEAAVFASLREKHSFPRQTYPTVPS